MTTKQNDFLTKLGKVKKLESIIEECTHWDTILEAVALIASHFAKADSRFVDRDVESWIREAVAEWLEKSDSETFGLELELYVAAKCFEKIS